MRLILLADIVLFAACAANADLIDHFAGYQTVWEIGTSGLQSSYDADTRANHALSGAITGSALPTLGLNRVTYPGVGEVPSPGGALGPIFDQGAIGVQADGDQLTVQLATALNPLTGYYVDGFQSWYTQGDVFLSVQDATGVSQFALLTSWARDPAGSPIAPNRDFFADAQLFHLTGGAGSSSLEGHLVRLTDDADVAATGGAGAYGSSNAPSGLDLRAYANGGMDLGQAGLLHSQLIDNGKTWYVQQWTLSLDALSSAQSFDIALHAAPSCGNDQIGGIFRVPEPGALLIAVVGAALIAARRLV
jgi:hypothetical protein